MNDRETTIRNRRDDLVRVVAAVNRFAAQHRLAKEVVADLQVALSEILTNIVDYGYIDDVDHEIGIRLRVIDNVIEATIEDDGIPFNPLERDAPDVSAPLKERRVGGLGIHFVKTLMNEVAYDRVGDYNRVVLKKKLSA
jgi:anti-sigma regulatory factor (Ser/Thr protein kinase)